MKIETAAASRIEPSTKAASRNASVRERATKHRDSTEWQASQG